MQPTISKALSWRHNQNLTVLTYKHLKGQLDPPVGNGNVFCTKGGQLDPPVSLISSYNLFQGKQNCQMLKYN